MARDPARLAAGVAALAMSLASAGVGGAVDVPAALDHLSASIDPRTGGPASPRSRAPALAAWTALAAAAAGEDPAASGVGTHRLARALGARPSGPVLEVARWAVAAGAARRLTPAQAAAVRRSLARAAAPADALTAAWVLLAARVSSAPRPDATLTALRVSQRSDGGFSSGAEGPSDTAATGAAVQALVAWGEPRDGAALHGARTWLAATRTTGGGMPAIPGDAPDAVSTAWAALAVASLGESPDDAAWGLGGWLRGVQRADGGVPLTAGGAPSVFATALAVLAWRGTPLPVAVPPAGRLTRRAPWVVRRSPASGDPPGPLVTVVFQDDPGGTGVDPARVRFMVGGVDRTAVASVSRFTLQVDARALGPLPAVVALRLVDRAGNTDTVRWTIAARRS